MSPGVFRVRAGRIWCSVRNFTHQPPAGCLAWSEAAVGTDFSWNPFCLIFKLAGMLGRADGLVGATIALSSSRRCDNEMIQPNCRVQFAAEDIDFILSVLAARLGTAECLVKLLADEESRDLILDDEALVSCAAGAAGLSAGFQPVYFYILVRKRFPPFGPSGPGGGRLRGGGACSIFPRRTSALCGSGPDEPARLLF